MEVQPHLLNLSAYINQNLEKDLPLSSLAKRVGLSPFHFHRKFGAYFGESLHQHIKRLRLERAAYALVNGLTPVRQIARESGYKTVSAFSHAFSGFAGESPTRYRSIGVTKFDGAEAAEATRSTPAWVGELEPQQFAFVRITTTGKEARHSIRTGMDLVTSLAGQPASSDGELPFIAATCDLFRVATRGEFRIDVGCAADRVSPDRWKAVGVQTLPGGRYARFDFRCDPDAVVGRCLDASLHGLKNSNEMVRLAQYFLYFGDSAPAGQDGADDGERDFQFFVPLA